MKKLLFIGTLLISQIAYSQPMITLDKFIQERNLNDPTEFAYLGERCASLYGLLVGYFQENGDGRDVNTINAVKKKSEDFRKVALNLDMNANKKSTQAIIDQNKFFIDVYGKQIKQNKMKDNNAFQGYVLSDMQICNTVYPKFEEFAKLVK